MKYILTMGLSLLVSFIMAQTLSLSGQVSDRSNGEALTGVSVQEKGTTNGVITDLNGQYTIQVPQGATLIFSFIGFANQELEVKQASSLDIILEAEAALLDEVVITALGLERSSKKLGYAVQKLEAAQISEVKSANFVDNLAGKLAGVTISQGATGIGSTSRITIRGESSFTNNNPLFVVDGIPINNNSILNFTNEAAAGFQEVDFGNGAMEVNADDIASVSVLKGPGAAALYGTRASNGVIIITTKDGSSQKGLGVSFNSSTFIETAFRLPDFQNQFGQGNSGQFEFVDGLGGGTNDNITYSWGPALDQGILIPQFDSPVALANGQIVRGGDVAVHGGAPISSTPFSSQPDNLKNFYRTGYTTTNNLAISSGFDQGSFRLSFTDLRNESIIPGSDLKRKTLSTKLHFKPIDKLNIRSSISYVNSKSDNRPANGYGSENVNYSLVAWGPRSLNIDNLRDYWQPGLEGLQQYAFNYTFFDNPYFILNENQNSFNRDRLFGNIAASYQLNKEWSLNLRTGMDYSNEDRRFLRNFSSNRFRNGAYAEHDVFYRENNTDLLLNYKKNLSDFSLDVSIGANRLDQKASTKQSQTLSLAQPGIFKLSNAASPIEVFELESRKRINSVYGIAKLGYKDFLFLDITGRNDWSSALATPSSTDQVSFFYPSLSGSFVLSNVIDLPENISFAKLRASWAQVGNDTDPYQTSGAFQAQTPFNNQPTFSAGSLIANGSLLPEKTSAIEFGADLRFLDDRLRLDVSYYNSLTENQIIALPVSIASGFNEQVVNGGAVRSKGAEIVLGITPIRKRNFSWDSQVNFSRNISTVEDLPDEIDRLTLAYSRVYDNVNQTVWFQVDEGGRIGDIYGTGYLRNEAGDFVIDQEGRYIVDNELKKLGNYNPDFIIGFNNRFNYNNWSLSFVLDWRQGGELVSRTLSLAAVGGQLAETAERPEGGIVAEGVVNVGTTENPVYQPNTVAVSAERYYRQFYDRNHEENNVYNATYVKLRELTISYRFGSAENRGFFSDGRSLELALIGRNLLAFSEIPHFDPEQLAVQGNNFVSGVEDLSYATSRSIGFRLGFNF